MTCERTRNISKRRERPQKGILEVKLFDVWRINFMDPVPPSYNNLYMLVAVDYVSKWGGWKRLPQKMARFFKHQSIRSGAYWCLECSPICPKSIVQFYGPIFVSFIHCLFQNAFQFLI